MLIGEEQSNSMSIMQDKDLGTSIFCLNSEECGGQQVLLTTEVFSNGDPGADGIHFLQKLSISSGDNFASMSFFNIFRPDNLRELADMLEEQQKNAENYLATPG